MINAKKLPRHIRLQNIKDKISKKPPYQRSKDTNYVTPDLAGAVTLSVPCEDAAKGGQLSAS